MTLSRGERWNEALERCPEGEGELRVPALALKVKLLGRSGRYGEAAELAEQALALGCLEPTAGSIFWQARAAHAWRVLQDRKLTMDFALHALRSDAWNHQASELLCQAGGEDSRRFRLLAHGHWHTPLEDEIPEFYRTFDVEAPSLEEAQELARAQEPEEVRAGMTWEKVQDFGCCPAGLGLIHATGHLFC